MDAMAEEVGELSDSDSGEDGKTENISVLFISIKYICIYMQYSFKQCLIIIFDV